MSSSEQSGKKRVLLIGWDAADWQLIDPLLKKGFMPNLQKFLDEGVRGNICTLFPILSPILWNSIASGKTADKHGILGFTEPDGKGYIRPVTSTSRRCKAVWNILSQSGKRSCVVGWYASHPAERINGVVVTDQYRTRRGEGPNDAPLNENFVHPASLIEPLADLIVDKNDITGEQILPFIPKALEIDHTKDLRLAGFASVLADCATIHNAATYLAEKEEWDLLAVYYDAIDHFGHGFMEYHPPRMAHVSERDFEMYCPIMTRVVEYHDMMLGRLLELVGPETTVIILSDHGFLNDERRPPLYWDAEKKKKVGPGMNPVAWHRPFGIVALRGPGIKKGATITGASLLDITPTVLYALGLPVADDMDGKPLLQAFDHPPEVAHIPTYEGEHPDDGVHRGEVREDPWEAQEALRQLAELGYIESPGEDKAKAVESTIRDRQMNLSQVQMGVGRYHDAARTLRELLAMQPKDTSVRGRLLLCLLSIQRFDEAERTLEGCGEDPEREPMLALMRAQILFHHDRFEEGMALLEKVRALFPKLHLAQLYMGKALLKAQKWEEAERVLRGALEIEPEDPESNDRLGVALRHLGRLEDAIFHHMKSVSLVHHQPIAHINLGVSLVASKQFEWAIEAFKVAISMAPGSAFAHRMLGYLYTRARREPELAKYHRHKAAELRMEINRRRAKAALEERTWT